MPTTTNFDVNIGRRHPDNYPFNGFIDEVRIYNVALSASEVLKRYNHTK